NRIAQSSQLRRIVSGRRHGCGWDSPRYFHYGRASDCSAGFIALRTHHGWTGSGNATPEEIARNRRILDGVIRGIGFYGNCFGVPTVGGEVVFEPCYSNNPLVNALALGIARREEL